MALPPSALDALENAVAAAPDNIALRLHLAGALLDVGRVLDAGAHCAAILELEPGHGDALVLGERAARLAGDVGRASVLEAARQALADAPEPVLADQPRRRTRRRPGF